MRRTGARRPVALGCALALTGLLAACGGGPDNERVGGGTYRNGFPVTVEDCAGQETTIDAAPERIVTSNAASLELLLRLGAGDRVIGTGFPPSAGALPGQLDEQARAVPVLGEGVIDRETLLGSGADLYIDTFAATGALGGAAGFPTEEEFAAAGIAHMFLLSTACAGTLDGPREDLSAVLEDIRRLGAATGTTDRAGELVTDMTRRLDAVEAAVGGVPADERPTYWIFDHDAGTERPMAVCNRQVAHAVLTLAAVTNVFGDCDTDFRPSSWEDVVSADPDWIQLAVRNRGDAAALEAAFDEAEEFLRTHPATRGLTAVREGRFLRIGSEVTTIAGVRNAETVETIARAVHADRFPAAGEDR
ncbi:ABC transporter substrate-binding protein [Streptomyces litchfieldiae]|uniref:ABC transporter substrate-binding protein n=1 Tax=Streptomyces litchfieldiae TaxID=3075543 RepID=A0ABU2N1E0_9ACTN|nr:ABC transporter substrate-binding protein [Streptomyces sp. DSM 44938]MDT0347566.1 ABC transporter substrate-binding protein [Streptomyces sp. DSM 44938]